MEAAVPNSYDPFPIGVHLCCEHSFIRVHSLQKKSNLIFYFKMELKKINIAIFTILSTVTLWSQAPNYLNYQAVIRDVSGNIMENQQIVLDISIRKNQTDGPTVCEESFTTSTDDFGLITLQIGSINPGDFGGIDWSEGSYFLEISLNGILLGTSQLLSVPYAIHAGSAEKLTGEQLLANIVSKDNSVGNSKLKDVSNPTDPQDAATKAYVDQLRNIIHNDLLELGYDGAITDIDGNVYKALTIGNQIWMAENLRTTKYRDGTQIFYPGNDTVAWENDTTGSYTWYNNDRDSYAQTYGALYNWYSVSTEKLCPENWHVPDDSEWKQLEMFLGMSEEDANAINWRGTNEGEKLKTLQNWFEDGHGTDSVDFAAAAGGYCTSNYNFNNLNYSGVWWTSTEYNTDYAFRRLLSFENTTIFRDAYTRKHGFSVRCIKD